MAKACDHTSVGMIVWRNDSLLLIERAKFPFGFAAPAGHIDGDKSFEDAAIRELKEEVGLEVKGLKLLREGRKENHCRRDDGLWHHWKIFEINAAGEISRSLDETKEARWYTKDEVKKLAERTERYARKEISLEEWNQNPGLEPVWYEWFKELKII